jgi:hypothetical protein
MTVTVDDMIELLEMSQLILCRVRRRGVTRSPSECSDMVEMKFRLPSCENLR